MGEAGAERAPTAAEKPATPVTATHRRRATGVRAGATDAIVERGGGRGAMSEGQWGREHKGGGRGGRRGGGAQSAGGSALEEEGQQQWRERSRHERVSGSTDVMRSDLSAKLCACNYHALDQECQRWGSEMQIGCL